MCNLVLEQLQLCVVAAVKSKMTKVLSLQLSNGATVGAQPGISDQSHMDSG